MCYSYNKDFRQDVKKDDSKDGEARQEPRAVSPDFKFWAFPRRGKKPAAEDPATSIRTREKV